MRDNRRSWFTRVSEISAVSWTSFVFTSLFALLAYLVANSRISWANPAANMLSILASQIVLFLVVYINERLFVCRFHGRTRSVATLVSFVIASAVRGISLAVVERFLAIEGVPTLTYRVVGSVTVMSSVLTVSTVMVASLDEHARLLSAVNAERDRLASTRAAISDVLGVHTGKLVSQIMAQLQSEVSALSTDQPAEAVERLRRVAHEIVRPLSHQLAHEQTEFSPAPLPERLKALDWRQALRDATQPRMISPTALALVIPYMASNLALNQFGARNGGLLLVTSMSVIAVSARRMNSVLEKINRDKSPGWRTFNLTIGLAVVAEIAATSGWFITREDPYAWLWFPAGLFVVGVGWFLAISQAASKQYAASALELANLVEELRWEVARANADEWQRRRTLSRELHGPLQSTINAAALRLQLALSAGTVSEEFVSALSADILRSVSALEQRSADAWDARLAFERIKATWAGLCEVDIEMSPHLEQLLQSDDACRGAVIDIVTEACSNAVRHGKAKRVLVTFEALSERELQVVVQDDGSAIDEALATPGLGTQLLDEVALRWERTPTLVGTSLAITLPLQSA